MLTFPASAVSPPVPSALVGRDDRVAFLSINPKDLTAKLDQQGDAPGSYKPTWQLLNPDVFRTDKDSAAATQPEYLQCFLGIGRVESVTGSRKPNLRAAYDKRMPYYLWAHVYQCKELRAVDVDSGCANPMIEVRMGSFSWHSNTSNATTCPLYYETFVVPTDLPPEDDDLAAAPLVQVTAYHKDDPESSSSSMKIIGQVARCSFWSWGFGEVGLSIRRGGWGCVEPPKKCS